MHRALKKPTDYTRAKNTVCVGNIHMPDPEDLAPFRQNPLPHSLTSSAVR